MCTKTYVSDLNTLYLQMLMSARPPTKAAVMPTMACVPTLQLVASHAPAKLVTMEMASHALVSKTLLSELL